MKLSSRRIPLALALSTAVALAAGCDNRDVDRGATAQTADERAETMQPAAPATTPADTMTQGDAAPGTVGADTMTQGDASPGMVGDGSDSDQPVDDTWITTKVKSTLLADTDVAGLDIDVETLNGVVTLTGQVDEQSQIENAARIARGVEGVTEVRTTGLVTGGN